MKTLFRQAANAAATGTLLMGGAMAQAANLPPLHHSGQTEYLSGGIGKDESTAITQAGKKWPLMLEFAVQTKQHAEFTANVNVVVHDAKRHEALQAEADGPLMLARLAPGAYAVDATLDGKTLHQKVTVRQGRPAKLVFVWSSAAGNKHS